MLKGEDDGLIVRDIPVSEVIVDCKTVVYEIKVLTGDRRGAGTDANVSIVLYGENGNSGPPKILQSSSNNFERGKFIHARSHQKRFWNSIGSQSLFFGYLLRIGKACLYKVGLRSLVA